MAGMDWMQGFMTWHGDISLCKPENTSVARASAFNVVDVKAFMVNYETLFKKHSFTPGNIYNIDETGVSTVMETPKVISKCGQKQVRQATSTERGRTGDSLCYYQCYWKLCPSCFHISQKEIQKTYFERCSIRE